MCCSSNLLLTPILLFYLLLFKVHVENDLSLRFLSWNVKGMNSPMERSRVFSHLKQLRVDVAFLQETHLHVKGRVE